MDLYAQSDKVTLNKDRVGRFTASTFSDLLTEPRSKADKEAGLLSETAKGVIIRKAMERIVGHSLESGAETWSMKRGIVLEAAALEILKWNYHDELSAASWQAHGENLGATPDAFLGRGGEIGTLDVKCPTDPMDVVLFGLAVQDRDFDSLLKWNKNYAWQIMVQAYVSGTRYASLVYFTDQLAIREMSDEGREKVQRLIDDRCEQYSQERLYPFEYAYASSGYFYQARRFELTNELIDTIRSTVEKAEVHVLNYMAQLKGLIK